MRIYGKIFILPGNVKGCIRMDGVEGNLSRAPVPIEPTGKKPPAGSENPREVVGYFA
jgi:hypothetical protein